MATVDNRERGRFESPVDDGFAFVSYRLDGETIIFTYAEVPEAFRGRGIGDAVVRAALDSARERGLTVVPRCSFVAAFIRRHPEYQELLGGD